MYNEEYNIVLVQIEINSNGFCRGYNGFIIWISRLKFQVLVYMSYFLKLLFKLSLMEIRNIYVLFFFQGDKRGNSYLYEVFNIL